MGLFSMLATVRQLLLGGAKVLDHQKTWRRAMLIFVPSARSPRLEDLEFSADTFGRERGRGREMRKSRKRKV